MSNQQNEEFEEARLEAEAEEIEEVMDKAEELTKPTEELEKKQELPEAPISITVRGYYKGFSVLITKRNATGEVELNKIMKAIDNMVGKGFKPSWNETTNSGVRVLPEVPATPAPTCGVHGTPMVWKTGISKSTGKPYAFWSCSTKNADGSYCKYTPPKAV